MEVWTAAATAKNKIQAREHRGSEPTSTRSCLSRPGLLLPTVPGAASGGLRKEPDLSPTMSQSSLQHTFLCSLLSDSILTERKKLRSHLIYSRQPRSLPPTFTEHISGTSNSRFLEITPRAQPGPPECPWIALPMGQSRMSKAESIVFLSNVTDPSICDNTDTWAGGRGESYFTASCPYLLPPSASLLNFTSHTFLNVSSQNPEIQPHPYLPPARRGLLHKSTCITQCLCPTLQA